MYPDSLFSPFKGIIAVGLYFYLTETKVRTLDCCNNCSNFLFSGLSILYTKKKKEKRDKKDVTLAVAVHFL